MVKNMSENPVKPESEMNDDFVSVFFNDGKTTEKSPTVPEPSASGTVEELILEEQVIDALRGIYDPEIPVNIYDLGLIYDIDMDDEGAVKIQMTLTSPGCPVAQTFPGTVECAVKCVDGVSDAQVELVWDPPWTKERMSEDALLSLGLL